LVTAGLNTVAVRVPATDLAQKLLAEFAGPVAAPSANPSGKISPTRAQHVVDGLTGKIAAVLDGGACGVGVESTIVGVAPDPVLLRHGGLSTEAIEQCLGHALTTHETGGVLTAPGQMASHYAPDAAMRLNATTREKGELMLGFGQVVCDMNLSPSGDLLEAAANLFHHMRELDQMGADRIAVSPIPEVGLGRAINDRLRRAAAPRP
jgi:L-threonylcarbamoyladenylate synthase